jgi:hypothetical protein
MSAYKKIKCNLVNKDSLLKALEVLGFQPDVYEVPFNLKGYRNDTRKEVANIIVTKEQLNSFTGASNDLGFLWNEEENKYEMICSEYDTAHKVDERVIQAYTKVVLEEALEKQGFKIKVNIADVDLQNKKQIPIQIVARKII